MTSWPRNLPVSSTTAIFAAGANAGVEAEDGELAGGRGEQEVLEIVAEDGDGVGIGALLEFEADFGGDVGVEEALPGVFDGEGEVGGPVAGLFVDFGTDEVEGALGFEFDDEIEDGGGFAAADGEHAVRGDLFDGLAVVVIHGEFLVGVGGVGDFFADDDAFVEHGAAEELADVGTFADGFGDDAGEPSSASSVVTTFLAGSMKVAAKVLSGAGVGSSVPGGRRRGVRDFLAGDGGLSAPLGAIREVEVFEFASIEEFFRCGLSGRQSVCLVRRWKRGIVSLRDTSSAHRPASLRCCGSRLRRDCRWLLLR